MLAVPSTVPPSEDPAAPGPSLPANTLHLPPRCSWASLALNWSLYPMREHWASYRVGSVSNAAFATARADPGQGGGTGRERRIRLLCSRKVVPKYTIEQPCRAYSHLPRSSRGEQGFLQQCTDQDAALPTPGLPWSPSLLRGWGSITQSWLRLLNGDGGSPEHGSNTAARRDASATGPWATQGASLSTAHPFTIPPDQAELTHRPPSGSRLRCKLLWRIVQAIY